MQAREIMTENPTCVAPSESVRQAAKLMADMGCGLLPVVDNMQNKRLVGIITDRDITCRVVAAGADCNSATVQNAMTTERFWTVNPNDSVDTVIDRMEAGHVRRIPVVDNENRVMGVIAMADIAQEVDEEDVVAEVLEEVSKPTSIPHS